MKRLTTPTHEFLLEIDPSEWDEFRITYKQAGRIVLERTEADVYHIEETGTFQANVKTEIQIRCHYPDGTSFASDIIPMNVAEVLNQEILGDDD